MGGVNSNIRAVKEIRTPPRRAGKPAVALTPARWPNAAPSATKVSSAAYISLIIHNFRCGLYVSLTFGSLHNGAVATLTCTTCLTTKLYRGRAAGRLAAQVT